MNYLDRNEFNYAPSQEVVRYIETSSPLFPDPRGWEQDDAHS